MDEKTRMRFAESRLLRNTVGMGEEHGKYGLSALAESYSDQQTCILKSDTKKCCDNVKNLSVAVFACSE